MKRELLLDDLSGILAGTKALEEERKQWLFFKGAVAAAIAHDWESDLEEEDIDFHDDRDLVTLNDEYLLARRWLGQGPQ